MTKLMHKHGGKILCITAIAHDTYGGIASWYYIGSIEWCDGSISAASDIAPWAICYDHQDKEACAEYTTLSERLSDYLAKQGAWVEKIKGRPRGGWVPHKKTGRQEIERVPA